MNKVVLGKVLIGIVIAIAAAGIVVGALALTGNLGNGKTDGSETGNDGNKSGAPELDPNQGDYVPPEPVAPTSGGISIPGWVSITMPAGQTVVGVDFPNPEANSGKYYLTFQLRLKDTDEVLYTSGLVEPGKHIQTITLSRALDVGTYDAVIHVQPYRMDAERSATNNSDVEVELKVV